MSSFVVRDILLSTRIARINLLRSKGRTMLSILGVFLGALLLTTVMHILGSISLGIEEKAVSLGLGIITVTPERPLFSRANDELLSLTRQNQESLQAKDVPKVPESIEKAATLKPEELTAIVRQFPTVLRGIPFILQSGQAFYGAQSSKCQFFGITADFISMRRYAVAYGRFFNTKEDKKRAAVCVLGNSLAIRLFGKVENAVGKHIRIEYSQLQVLGVFPPLGADSSDTNLDEVIFMPLSTLMHRLSFRDHVDGFFVQLLNKESFVYMKAGLEHMLRNLHKLSTGEMQDFSISRAENVEDMVANAYELMTLLGFIGASISFAIGSLGIFSVMTLMVHSRRAEIGIRRATGTPAKIILQQFLCEAGLMSGIGGILGSMGGLLFILALSSVGIVQDYYNFTLTGLVVLLSLACGLLAGGYPAYKASRLEIITALRGKK